MTDLLLSVAMIGIFLLTGGGIWMLAKRHDRKRGLLMLGAAGVMAVNVWLASLPAPHPVP